MEHVKTLLFISNDYFESHPEEKEHFDARVKPMILRCFSHQGSTKEFSIFLHNYPTRIIITDSIFDPTGIAMLQPSKKIQHHYLLHTVCGSSVGIGIGNRIMDAVTYWARQKQYTLTLSIYLFNPELERIIYLYTKYGFTFTEKDGNFYNMSFNPSVYRTHYETLQYIKEKINIKYHTEEEKQKYHTPIQIRVAITNLLRKEQKKQEQKEKELEEKRKQIEEMEAIDDQVRRSMIRIARLGTKKRTKHRTKRRTRRIMYKQNEWYSS
jgi:hypothetical protein